MMPTTYEPVRESYDLVPIYPTSPSQGDSLENISDDVGSSNASPAISRQLYISHFLSTWNVRGFEFGAVLFLATIFPRTLLPMSVYALVRAASAIFLSPMVGRYIDNGDRLQVVRVSIGKSFTSTPHVVWKRKLSMYELCG
jgi:hypothetical protein